MHFPTNFRQAGTQIKSDIMGRAGGEGFEELKSQNRYSRRVS